MRESPPRPPPPAPRPGVQILLTLLPPRWTKCWTKPSLVQGSPCNASTQAAFPCQGGTPACGDVSVPRAQGELRRHQTLRSQQLGASS